jgi:CheY-like chemotaxis protein
MKILILEDDDIRIAIFQQYFLYLSQYTVYYVKTASDAITLLEGNSDFDLAFLDHDLGGEVFVDSGRPDTGAGVTRWLAESGYNRDISITIHSLNPSGQIAMQHTLLKSGFNFVHIMPFTQLAVFLCAGIPLK